MKRTKIAKGIVYAGGVALAIALSAGGYFWYTVRTTMNDIYEPLPSAEWVAPDFSEEPAAETVPIPETSGAETEAPAKEEKTEKETAIVPVSVTDAGPSEPLRIGEKDIERLRNPDIGDREPFAMLLLGVDERPGDRGRSDTMILIAVQPKDGKAAAISIPRDTRARMPHSGGYDKINHAYAYGGVPSSVQAVEQLFGVPIAYYMKTNMEGLVRIVNTLGGVDVDNVRAFEYEGHSFPRGKQHLDGEEALAYSRMRKEDPQGDFGRTERQRQIVTGAVDKLTNAGAIVKLPKLLSHLSEYVRTNLGPGQMQDLLLDYRPAIGNVDVLRLQGMGTTIDGIYYYGVTADERRRIQAELLERLSAG